MSLLGGGTGLYGVSTYDSVATSLSEAFEGGAATALAQGHLVNGACH